MKSKIIALAALLAITTTTGCNLITGSIADGKFKMELNLPTGDQ